MLFSKVAAPLYVLASSVWGFHSLHPCQHLSVFDFSHTSGCEVSHCSFDLYSLDGYMILNIFLCAYWPFVYPLWRNIYSDPLPIFKLSHLPFLLLSCKRFLYILGASPLARYMIYRYPICRLSFYFLDNVFWSTKVLMLSKSKLYFVACILILCLRILCQISEVMKI